MFEITKKDARKFRELPLVVEEGITYYYDFTIMDRYVVFHSKSDIFVQYEMYDKVSHIQHKILKDQTIGRNIGAVRIIPRNEMRK